MPNYFIISNNQQSIKKIKQVFEDYHEFSCIGIADNYDEAMTIIIKQKPNIVFFNIDNTIKEPFNFVNEFNLFGDEFPMFIAITGTKDLLYKIIKNGFVDVLLTPLKELEIRKTVVKLRKKIAIRTKRNICLKSYKDFQYVKTDEIMFLKADNNTTDFFMDDGSTISAYKTLKTFESMLPNNFHRIHRSYIINKNYVTRIQYGKMMCTIKKNKHEVPFTRTHISSIENINKELSGFSSLTIN